MDAGPDTCYREIMGSKSGGNGKDPRALREEHATNEAVDRVRAIAVRTGETASSLRALGVDRVATALGDATAALLDGDADLGREARALLPDATGLSPPMIEWALRTTLAPLDRDALRTAARRAHPAVPDRFFVAPPRLTVVVLAGNVFTASVRGLFLPLLSGSPVVAKASSREDVFPRLLARAIAARDPDVGASIDVVTFPGGSVPLEDALFARADVVSAFGGDATLAAIRARLPATARFVAHGHGLGVAYVAASALGSTNDAEHAATAIALDVAAYDQRGCLSPHAVLVERGGAVDARTFARILSEHALARLARELPRGALPTSAGGAQVQWRGVAAARAELFEGDGWATSYEAGGALRISPGYRNVAVLDCDGAEDLASRLLSLGVHLKAIGVAGDLETRRRVALALPPPLAPRISPAGTMQTPPFDALADGEPPFTGLSRYVELE